MLKSCISSVFLMASAYAVGPRDAVLCPLNEYIDDNDETVREYFECPGLDDPPSHTLCCEDKCCAMVDSVLQVQGVYQLSFTIFSLFFGFIQLI